MLSEHCFTENFCEVIDGFSVVVVPPVAASLHNSPTPQAALGGMALLKLLAIL